MTQTLIGVWEEKPMSYTTLSCQKNILGGDKVAKIWIWIIFCCIVDGQKSGPTQETAEEIKNGMTLGVGRVR